MNLLDPNKDYYNDYFINSTEFDNHKLNGPNSKYGFTARLAAKIFIPLVKQHYRYEPHIYVWYYFNGRKWDTSKKLFSDLADSLEALKQRLEPSNWFTGLNRIYADKFINALIHILEQCIELHIKESEFDTNPHILNTPNGTYNLLTGERYVNRMLDFCKQITAVSPEDDLDGLKCPNYMKHKQFMADDRSGYDNYLDELSGYVSTGLTNLKEFYWWYGFRDTGKSSLANIWRYCLGDYACMGDQEQFVQKQFSAHRQLEMRLKNKRFVFIDEIDGQKINGAKIKSFTSGSPIVANNMRENSSEFAPIAKLLIASNHYLSVDEDDSGFAGRLRLAEFFKEVPLQDRIGSFEETVLRPEAPYVLNRMIRYATKIINQKKLNMPEDMANSIKDYLNDNNIVARMLAETTKDSPMDHVTNKDLIAAANMWSMETGYDLPVRNRLLKLIKGYSRRYKQYKNNNVLGILGLTLKTEWREKIRFSYNAANN